MSTNRGQNASVIRTKLTEWMIYQSLDFLFEWLASNEK